MTRTANWPELAKTLETPPQPRHTEGIWNGRYFAPYALRTDRVFIEPLSPRITQLDYDAYMSSIQHINDSMGWGFPTPDLTLEWANYDMHKCWNAFGRGEGFYYAVLSPDRSEELGAVYFKQPAAGTHPREAEFTQWVVEQELETDLDRHLLQSVVNWVRSDWDIERLVHPLPEGYERGHRLAEELGLRRDSAADRPGFVSYVWESSPGG